MPIEFIGKTYKNFEEMPPDVQVLYEKTTGIMGDKNGNDVLDIYEDEVYNCFIVGSENGVVFRGVTYKSFAEMPEDMRPTLQKAFNELTMHGMVNPWVYELMTGISILPKKK